MLLQERKHFVKKYPDSNGETAPVPFTPTRLGDLAPRYRPPCVVCGKASIILSHGRCVRCLSDDMRRCWRCGGDIGEEIDRELRWRVREASWDVNDAWVAQDMFGRYRLRERVLQARNGKR